MKVLLTSDTHYGLDGKTHNKHAKFWKNVKKKIDEQDIKVLIWAGDIAVNKQRQFARSLAQAREYVSIPILLVRGNHDWWDGVDRKDKSSGRRSFNELNFLHQELFKKYNIHYLGDGPAVYDNVVFCGWDGWYGSNNPPTNDERWMFKDVEGCPMHTYMSNRAWKQFESVLQIDVSPYRKSVAITHHPPYCDNFVWKDMCANLKFYDMIKEKFDFFCCGHNHKAKDRIENGCRVLNSGSDYNDPKFAIFEV